MQWSNKKNDTIFFVLCCFIFFSFCFLVIIVAAYTSALCSVAVCMSVRTCEKTAAQLCKCSKRKVCIYECICVHVDHVNTNLFTATGKWGRRNKKHAGNCEIEVRNFGQMLGLGAPACYDQSEKLISDSPFTKRCSDFSKLTHWPLAGNRCDYFFFDETLVDPASNGS